KVFREKRGGHCYHGRSHTTVSRRLRIRGTGVSREGDMEAAQKKEADKSVFSDYDYSNFYYGAGDDPLNVLPPFSEWYREARPNGYYLYAEAVESAPG